MRAIVLGAAAGGGFPQWNCNAPQSRAVRLGQDEFLSRTQSSLAVSADGLRWVVLNASPDLRQQIQSVPQLHPRGDGPLRNSPLAAVILTNADVDHIAGLITLREKTPFVLYATRRILDVLAANAIFNVLDPSLVERRELPLSGAIEIEGPEGPLGLTVEPFAVPGKIALFLEDGSPDFGSREGDTIGLSIHAGDPGKRLVYIPGCAAVDAPTHARAEGAAALLFDGTVFTDDEMPAAGIGEKTGQRMGHLHISGADGSIAAWADAKIGRRVYVHINNTNPVLRPGSPQEAEALAAGWEIATDGMEIAL